MKIKLVVLAILFMIIGLATIANAQNKTVRDHTKLQNSVSYETRIKENKAFSLKSAKQNLASAKKKNRKEKKKSREKEKIQAIKEKTLAIKNK